jgi:pimeloyl-ACP methyl ester carboxylesterase
MKKFIALGADEYKLGKDIVPVSLSWETKTIKGWCDQVEVTKEDILIGHSIGGAVALMVASKTPPKELHLYSPTPIFLEFLEMYKKYPTKDMVDRYKEFIMIPNVKCPVFIYIGGDEEPFMKVGSQMIAKSIENSVLKTLEGKDHITVVPKSIAYIK